MAKRSLKKIRSLDLRSIALAAAFITGAFIIGMQSSDSIHPASLIQAGSAQVGDMDGNGIITVEDAVILLEITQGYREVTPEFLLADPNTNGQLTVDDALTILHRLSVQ